MTEIESQILPILLHKGIELSLFLIRGNFSLVHKNTISFSHPLSNIYYVLSTVFLVKHDFPTCFLKTAHFSL